MYYPWTDPRADFRKWYLPGIQTLLTEDRVYTLLTLLVHSLPVPGSVWECGVYRGGSAAMMASILAEFNTDKRLHLFDTFEGMPVSDPRKDRYRKGDLCGTAEEETLSRVGHRSRVESHKGLIPETFVGLEQERLSFAHVDVDIYQSTRDCFEFIYPRLTRGGIIVCDDYGFPECPGAKEAVDEFCFASRCRPLVLASGQAVLFKSID